MFLGKLGSDEVFPGSAGESDMANSDKLNVFISSTMGELRDVRDVVQNELVEMGKDLFEPFVYEARAGA